MDDLDQTVASQYTNSPRIDALVALFDQAVGTDALFELFYTNLWNIDTAVGYGLDVWGRIVGIGRVLTVVDDFYFGFAQQDDVALVGTFGQAPFFSGETVTSNFSLTDEAYRKLIFAKAAANITSGSIPAINRILMDILFPGRGNAYVIDNQDMTMVYKFDFPLEPFELSIVADSGVLPTPTGVSFTVSAPA